MNFYVTATINSDPKSKGQPQSSATGRVQESINLGLILFLQAACYQRCP
ncbi:hypothetical protein [Microcoleus anatoxicus]